VISRRGRSAPMWLWVQISLVATAAFVTAVDSSIRDDAHGLTKFVPVDLAVRNSRSSAVESMQVFVPATPGEFSIGQPAELFDHVSEAWNAVVQHNQAGLVDAALMRTNPSMANAPLSEHEAWHHFQASQQGVIDSARFLVTFGIVPSVQTGGSLLHIAAAQGQADRCRQLLESPEANVQVDIEKSDGSTPLMLAAAMGHTDAVRVLLDAGANVEAVGRMGATSLMMAASLGHIEVVNVLIQHGADINKKHSYAGTTALHFAAEVGHVEVIRALCRAGADLASKKSTGGVALHTAADANQTEAIKVLTSDDCAGGIDLINALLMGDTTPLYLAAQRGFYTVIEVCSGSYIWSCMPRCILYDLSGWCYAAGVAIKRCRSQLYHAAECLARATGGSS